MWLFTTFEEDKGSSSDDYYLLLQERIKNRLLLQPKISNGRIEYIRPSTKYPGLTEYWSTAFPKELKKNHTWTVYYLANDKGFVSTENNPLVIRCNFFGVAPDSLKDLSRRPCNMQWNIDDSMSIEVRFSAVVLDDWKTMYHGLKTFVNAIRME